MTKHECYATDDNIGIELVRRCLRRKKCRNEVKKWGCMCKSVPVMRLKLCSWISFLILYVHLVGVCKEN